MNTKTSSLDNLLHLPLTEHPMMNIRGIKDEIPTQTDQRDRNSAKFQT